ncbi:MAG TPA: amidohydrolase, partial [Thermoanaerobaculia bacterium]|nr:amidohydrolase [Thermoanaerobaculia bacterium]
EEEKAAAWLEEAIADAGFEVEAGSCGMPTAFAATAGKGPLHIAFCAEYDCLPGIGHACGHNMIAAMSLGAAIAAAKAADDVGLTVHLLGTPAEEVGNDSGKIRLVEGGAFAGIHAAMMVHPAPFEMAAPRLIAASMFEVCYHGKESHAAAFPEIGINAADALTVAQVAIGLIRQHILPSDKIHGIVTKGGDAPNVVPALTRAKYIIRSETIDDLETLRDKIRNCFEAGAIATGSKLDVIGGDKPYAQVEHDPALAEIYRRNAEAIGRTFPDLGEVGERMAASTDMGNVSLAVPSIHPMIGIDSLPAVNHQPEFAAHCATEIADQAVHDGALAMALTAVDIAVDTELAARLMARTSARNS